MRSKLIQTPLFKLQIVLAQGLWPFMGHKYQLGLPGNRYGLSRQFLKAAHSDRPIKSNRTCSLSQNCPLLQQFGSLFALIVSLFLLFPAVQHVSFDAYLLLYLFLRPTEIREFIGRE